jgi:hypothetical protein
MVKFEVGQIFEDSYPPEAALWCNESGKYFIEEIGKEGDKRRFQIKETPAPTQEELAERARRQRDALLAKTDYLLASDYPISEERLEEIKVYRQALRDVPAQEGFPETIVWPETPEWL